MRPDPARLWPRLPPGMGTGFVHRWTRTQEETHHGQEGDPRQEALMAGETQEKQTFAAVTR